VKRDVAGTPFYPCTDMTWATYVAKGAMENALGRGVSGEWREVIPRLVDNALERAGFAVMDPFDWEETCQDRFVVAVVDVGENFPVPCAIYTARSDGLDPMVYPRGTVWDWKVCSNQRRYR
jgi:hypothetical protein